MEYRFKVEVELKDDLTESEIKEANKLIDQMMQKWEIHKLDDNIYIAEKSNEDLGSAVFFAKFLSKQAQYFKSIVTKNIEKGNSLVSL